MAKKDMSSDNIDMENSTNFTDRLEQALNTKKDWFNTVLLLKCLDNYRLIYTCIKNLSDLFVKKSLIIPDPYKLEQKISDITTVETEPFTENEMPKVLGARLSKYEMILDYVCTYFRFSVETIEINKIKTFLEFNNTFDWKNLSSNSNKPNTRALAEVISSARQNSPGVTASMITDSIEKCSKAIGEINSQFAELADFQREIYKGRIRKDIFEHPDFNATQAFSSPENEMAEIKRLYPKVIGKKSFYADLIQEIINEDQAPNKEALQNAVLAKLEIKQTSVKKVVKGPDPHFILMTAVSALGPLSPSLSQLYLKLSENFDLLYTVKNSLWNKFMAIFKKAFGIKEPERICTVYVENPKTGQKTPQKVTANTLMEDIMKKSKVYAGIMAKGPEYQKLNSASEDAVLAFLTRQISENQSLFTILNALDDHFKNNVDITLRAKVKGMKIELASYRNSIINVNKKRGEFTSLKEETEQMRKLGIKADE